MWIWHKKSFLPHFSFIYTTERLTTAIFTVHTKYLHLWLAWINCCFINTRKYKRRATTNVCYTWFSIRIITILLIQLTTYISVIHIHITTHNLKSAILGYKGSVTNSKYITCHSGSISCHNKFFPRLPRDKRVSGAVALTMGTARPLLVTHLNNSEDGGSVTL